MPLKKVAPENCKLIITIIINNSQFTIHNSQFTIHNSQFTINNSQFSIAKRICKTYIKTDKSLA